MNRFFYVTVFFSFFSASQAFGQTFDFIDCEGFDESSGIEKVEVKYKLQGHRITPMRVIKTSGAVDQRDDLVWTVVDRIGVVEDTRAPAGSNAKLVIDGTVSDSEPQSGWPASLEYQGRIIEGFTCTISNFEI